MIGRSHCLGLPEEKILWCPTINRDHIPEAQTLAEMIEGKGWLWP